MRRYVFRTLRALFITTLGVGGGVALFAMIVIIIVKNGPDAFSNALRWGMGIGFVYAIFFIAVLLPLDMFGRMFLSKGVYKDIWELEQVREVKLNGTSKEVLAACREALLQVSYVRSVSDDSEHLVTRAIVGNSLRSPGEEIEVEINPIAENTWIARCTSKPKGKNDLFDYGKNFENVETWVGKVKASGRADSAN